MKFYIGIIGEDSAGILTHLWNIRQDIGFCVSSFYLKEGDEAMDVSLKLRSLGMPAILDNGAYQTFKHGTLKLTDQELRDYYKAITPDWMIGPDVMGSPIQSTISLYDFAKNNNDLELLAPLHSINFQSVEAIEQEIGTLKDVGYRRFAIAKPYLMKDISRCDSYNKFAPIIRRNVEYFHWLAYPVGIFHGEYLTKLSMLDSADVGSYVIANRYYFQPYKYQKEAAQLLDSIINFVNTIASLPRGEYGKNQVTAPIFNRSLASVYG